MTAKFNEKFRVFPYVDSYLDKDGLGCVNIRIANRKDRNRNYNIIVLKPNGERLKLRPVQLKGREVVGMDEKTRIELTTLLDNLMAEINRMTVNTKFSKATVEQSLYGSEFLHAHKRKRTKFTAIELLEQTPTNYFRELRQLYPKKKEITETKSVDDDGFEKVERKNIVVDPLSMVDFPKNFNPELYEKLKKEFFKKFEGKKAYLEKVTRNQISLDAAIERWIRQHDLFFTDGVKEIVNVDKRTMQEFLSDNPSGMNLAVSKNSTGYQATDNTANTIIDIHKRNLASEERYKQGLWDKSNIFEIFGSIKYNSKISDTYNKVLIRLFQYRHFEKPQEHISFLSKDWFTEFFKYLWNAGYYNVSTIGFDPLKFDGSMFDGKTIKDYDANQLHSIKGILRTLMNKFVEDGLLKEKIELPDITKLTGKRKKSGRRIEHSLNNEQFNKFFKFIPSTSKLKKYNEEFQELSKRKYTGVRLTANNFVEVKDIFCVMVMAGGLRGYGEYSSVKFNKADDCLVITSNKTETTFINPLNVYTREIAKRYKWLLPQLNIGNTRSANNREEIINFVLKIIARELKFTTPLIYKEKETSIQEIFSAYFARKTFSQILFDEYRFQVHEIAMFTGHLLKTSQLEESYVNVRSMKRKRELFDKIKFTK